MTTDSTELLPCPFCGGTEIFIEPDELGSGGQWVSPVHVGCASCKTEQCCEEEAEAIAAWNRRAALSAAPDAQRERLDDGYISSTLVSGGNSHSITLHYKTARQAEFAHSCIVSEIDAAQAKEPK